MGFVARKVYTKNARTNEVDEWVCNGEFTGKYRGKTERLCLLHSGKKSLVLPKRCVFDTEVSARTGIRF